MTRGSSRSPLLKQTLERFYSPLKSRSFGLCLHRDSCSSRSRAFHPYKADFAWRPSGGARVWLLLGFQSPRLAALPALRFATAQTLLVRAKVAKCTQILHEQVKKTRSVYALKNFDHLRRTRKQRRHGFLGEAKRKLY